MSSERKLFVDLFLLTREAFFPLGRIGVKHNYHIQNNLLETYRWDPVILTPWRGCPKPAIPHAHILGENLLEWSDFRAASP
jgi:hypothetical protein